MNKTTIDANILIARLATIRAGLRLEAVGMKTRGGALRPRVAAEFGLSKRDPFPVFIARATEMIEELRGEFARSLEARGVSKTAAMIVANVEANG